MVSFSRVYEEHALYGDGGGDGGGGDGGGGDGGGGNNNEPVSGSFASVQTRMGHVMLVADASTS